MPNSKFPSSLGLWDSGQPLSGSPPAARASKSFKAAQNKIRIQVLLVTAITGLVLAGALGATVLQVNSFRSHAESEAVRLLSASAETALTKSEAIFSPALELVNYVRGVPLRQIVGNQESDRDIQFKRFLEIIEVVSTINNQIAAAYMGYPDGSFVLSNETTKSLRDLAGLPDSIKSAYIRLERDASLDTSTDRWSWRDQNDWRTVERSRMDYDPRSRPWYRLGSSADSPVWTDIYLSVGDNRLSITLANGLWDLHNDLAAVVGVDIRLDDLISFVDELMVSPNSFVFIARPDGELLAHPKQDSIDTAIESGEIATQLHQVARDDRIDLQLFEAFANSELRQLRIANGDEIVLGIRMPLNPELGLDASLYIGAPLSDFTEAANRSLSISLALTAIVTIAVVIIGILISRSIAKPINRLAATAGLIQRNQLGSIAPLQSSHFVELDKAARTFNDMVEKLREQETIRALFGRYVPEAVAADLLSEKGNLVPKTTEATILFVDLEGFTSLAESMPPADVVELLNEYFSVLVSILEEHGGVVTQFQGDAILATFNVPAPSPDHAAQAVRAALDMVEILDRRRFSGHRLSCRIGINTGIVTAGAVGATDRLNYTVHGDAVNLAARLEHLNKEHRTRILVSDTTFQATYREMNARFSLIGTYSIRGKNKQVPLYSLASLGTPVAE